MRGAGLSHVFNLLYIRITPACAGSSWQPKFCGPSRPDHPRLCGEQSVHTVKAEDSPGSPPPVRGAEKKEGITYAISRITPACAGSRPFTPEFTTRDKDHPRLCGEQPPRMGRFAGATGSPPPVRGAEGGESHPRLTQGITPACAGSRYTGGYPA